MDKDAMSRVRGTRPFPRLSLRFRLTLWVVAIFSLIHWGSGGVFWLYQRSSINQMYRDLLAEKTHSIAESVTPLLPSIPGTNLETITRRELRSMSSGRYRVDVLRPDGRSVVTGRTPAFEGDEIPITQSLSTPGVTHRVTPLDPGAREGTLERRRFITVLPVSSGGEPRLLVIEVGDAFVQRQLALLWRVLLLSGFIGPIAAMIAGWFIAGVAVAPLDRLRGFARNLSPESIGQKISVDDDDNSEVARLSRELDDARLRIQAAFQAQGRFLSNVSHEIKTPISVLMLEAQTLPREGMPEAYTDFLDSAQEEMGRLGNLVESFLTLTRVQDGKGVPRLLTYAANDLVMDSVDHCLGMAQQYHVRLSPLLLDREDEIDTAIHGEPELLRTMLDNLVRNAIRFSPKGKSVSIDLKRNGGDVVLCVLDSGPGIPPDQVDHIFDRFAQTEHGKRDGRGHGLGLEIAQGIAELHGGVIVASNREAEGACFTVTLPAYCEESENDTPVEQLGAAEDQGPTPEG